MVSKALLPDPKFTYENKIKCFAINHLINHIFICEKDKISVFSVETNKILRSFMYYETFFQIYQTKIKITAAEALVLRNLWVVLVNKRHFIFFDLELKYTRVYRGEQDKATGLRSLHRFDQLVTIKSDRKSIKFWKYDFLDLEMRNSERKPVQSMKKWFKQDLMAKKYLEVRSEVQSTVCDYAHAYKTQRDDFSIVIQVTALKLMHLGGKEVMGLVLAEDLKLFIMSFDDFEIGIYDTESYEKVATLDVFCSKTSTSESINSSSNNDRVVAIWNEQEMLFATDSRSLIVYDLVARHIIRNVQIEMAGQVLSLACSAPTLTGGIFFVSSQDQLQTFSIKDRTYTTFLLYLNLALIL